MEFYSFIRKIKIIMVTKVFSQMWNSDVCVCLYHETREKTIKGEEEISSWGEERIMEYICHKLGRSLLVSRRSRSSKLGYQDKTRYSRREKQRTRYEIAQGSKG